eukprot:GHVU01176731.1.p1 GENE.GHVU01176731.1~~GHVU01176731.1.p1  ORF type:complete len:115 (-),score=3.03 GHVU01176731.1:899-1243(-)
MNTGAAMWTKPQTERFGPNLQQVKGAEASKYSFSKIFLLFNLFSFNLFMSSFNLLSLFIYLFNRFVRCVHITMCPHSTYSAPQVPLCALTVNQFNGSRCFQGKLLLLLTPPFTH